MQIVGFEAQRNALAGHLAEFFDKPLAMSRTSETDRVLGDKGPLPVSHFQEPVSDKSLVDPQYGVLIDGQLTGQLTHGRQSVTWSQLARGTESGDLLGNLRGNRYRGTFFYPDKHDVAFRNAVIRKGVPRLEESGFTLHTDQTAYA